MRARSGRSASPAGRGTHTKLASPAIKSHGKESEAEARASGREPSREGAVLLALVFRSLVSFFALENLKCACVLSLFSLILHGPPRRRELRTGGTV